MTQMAPLGYPLIGQTFMFPIMLDNEFMKGEVHSVLVFDPLSTPKILDLVEGHQLVVSRDGRHASVLIKDESGLAHLYHTDMGEVGPSFISGAEMYPRILMVSKDAVLIWGRAVGEREASVWHIRINQFSQLVHLSSVTTEESEVLMGYSGSNSSQRLLVTGHGCFSIETSAKVTVMSDGSVLVLERYEGSSILYAYQFSVGGINDFTNAPCAVGEEPVQLLRWGGRFFLAVRAQEGSYLREFGGNADGETQTLIEGILEMAWNAPCERSIAYLTRVRTASGWIRRLFLNGELVHQGSFTMTQGGMYWSENGQSFIAVVTETESGQHILIGPDHRSVLPEGQSVREMLVGNHGTLDAVILTNGSSNLPFVGQRLHGRVPYAWNLHRTSDGSVAYNSIYAGRLMLWTDSMDRVVRT
jgi:hypothetical protein